MQPRLVKSMTNTDTGEVIETEIKTVRQVISSQTCDSLKSMMKDAVDYGKHATVKGYSVGGKSGTSEPTDGNADEGYVASFVALSPVENSQVVILVTLYDPTEKSIQGSQTAGPVVSKILTEVLPYLGIEPDLETSE
jgi:stage V sporulation protein D (sporulation-specific penicillin-binding protein)